MLTAFLVVLAVYLVAMTAISGAAIRICRVFGLEPREVLVWFGLAEQPPVHSGRRAWAPSA